MNTKHHVGCPSCGDPMTLTISFDVDGSEVVFHACHACENKWWERDGAAVDLHAVLPELVG